MRVGFLPNRARAHLRFAEGGEGRLNLASTFPNLTGVCRRGTPPFPFPLVGSLPWTDRPYHVIVRMVACCSVRLALKGLF